jgi:hypothetical protein
MNAPTPYRPSNGTEGDIFEAEFCERCKNWRDGECEINMRAYFNEIEDSAYPKEWIKENGEPRCTAFILY